MVSTETNQNISSKSINFNKSFDIGDRYKKLVESFIKGGGAEVFKENSEENKDPNRIYKQINIGTGSVIKAFSLSADMNNALPNVDDPKRIRDFWGDRIHNGNGALRKQTFLGFYNGMPSHAESAAEGETDENEPAAEAENKAGWSARKYRDENKHIERSLFVGIDTVNDGLGKPMNLPDFPRDSYSLTKKSEIGLIEGVVHKIKNKGKTPQQALESYGFEYFKKNYSSEKSTHENAVSIFEVLPNSQVAQVGNFLTTITTKIPPGKIEEMEFLVDVGGSGGTQQFINWEDKRAMYDSLDLESRKVFEGGDLDNFEKFRALYMHHIIGMPSRMIFKTIDQIIEREIKQNKLFLEMTNRGSVSKEPSGTKTVTKVA